MFIRNESQYGGFKQDVLAPENTGATIPKVKLGPGLVYPLLPGESIDSASTNRPNPNFEPFINSVLKQIGVALELPYEVLTKHFQSSYSAARGALLEAWRMYSKKRFWLIHQLCQPVYEWIIEEAIYTGLLEAPGFLDHPMKRKAWLSAEWIGTVWQEIDPLKAEKANTEAINNGTASRHDICAAKGKDYEQVAKKLDRENFPSKNPGGKRCQMVTKNRQDILKFS